MPSCAWAAASCACGAAAVSRRRAATATPPRSRAECGCARARALLRDRRTRLRDHRALAGELELAALAVDLEHDVARATRARPPHAQLGDPPADLRGDVGLLHRNQLTGRLDLLDDPVRRTGSASTGVPFAWAASSSPHAHSAAAAAAAPNRSRASPRGSAARSVQETGEQRVERDLFEARDPSDVRTRSRQRDCAVQERPQRLAEHLRVDRRCPRSRCARSVRRAASRSVRRRGSAAPGPGAALRSAGSWWDVRDRSARSRGTAS